MSIIETWRSVRVLWRCDACGTVATADHEHLPETWSAFRLQLKDSVREWNLCSFCSGAMTATIDNLRESTARVGSEDDD